MCTDHHSNRRACSPRVQSPELPCAAKTLYLATPMPPGARDRPAWTGAVPSPDRAGRAWHRHSAVSRLPFACGRCCQYSAEFRDSPIRFPAPSSSGPLRREVHETIGFVQALEPAQGVVKACVNYSAFPRSPFAGPKRDASSTERREFQGPRQSPSSEGETGEVPADCFAISLVLALHC